MRPATEGTPAAPPPAAWDARNEPARLPTPLPRGAVVSDTALAAVRKRVAGEPLRSGVLLEIELAGASAKSPILYGATNLPDDTDLMLSVSSNSPGFTGGSKAKVVNGTFFGGPFGPEEGLPIGRYTAEVMMPVPMAQPDSVRGVIGTNGENLKGPLVKKGDLGKIVEKKLAFLVGNDLDAATKAENVRHDDVKKDAIEILNGLRELRASGKRMAPLRRGIEDRDLAASAQCGELMRKYQAESARLRKRADSHGMIYMFRLLSSAAAFIDSCVCCSAVAAEGQFCKNADGAIRDAARELKKL